MKDYLYPDFPSLFIRTAILIAFYTGINMGTHVAFTIGFDFPLGPGFHAYIQTHGYLQLMGWAGLFIMGVSIHFLSRLAHLNQPITNLVKRIYHWMVGGLVLRFIAHSFLPYFRQSTYYGFFAWSTMISGLAVCVGIFLYLRFLFTVIKNMEPAKISPNRDIRVFLIMNVIGWIVFAVGSTILLGVMVYTEDVSLMQNWHVFLVDFFLLFTVFPICIGVGLRALPLFMRLPKIDWNVKRFSWIYFGVVVSIIGTKLFYHFIYITVLPKFIYSATFLKNVLLLWFVFKLDILFKTKQDWTEAQNEERIPHRRETRKGFPDYGEFGRFEWLIRSAFIWLVIGLFLDMMIQIGLLFKIQMGIGIDGVRHLWLAGFVSLLIMGMAVRMIPGMTGVMKLKHPNRVAWLAIVMNVSVLFRTLSIALPESMLNIIPNGSVMALRLFGFSGILFLIGLWIFYYIMKPVLAHTKNN